MYYLGIMTHLFDVNLDIVMSVIEKRLETYPERMQQNIQIFKNGYELAKTQFSL